jgi:hypothetical protein
MISMQVARDAMLLRVVIGENDRHEASAAL